MDAEAMDKLSWRPCSPLPVPVKMPRPWWFGFKLYTRVNHLYISLTMKGFDIKIGDVGNICRFGDINWDILIQRRAQRAFGGMYTVNHVV